MAPNWLGDAAMCTPALRALHKRFPEAELTVVGRASVCALLDGLPWISRGVTVPARPGLGAMRRAAREVRAHPHDLAVVFPHSFRAAFLAWLMHAPRRLGYARGGRSFLLTDRVEPYREDGLIQPIYMTTEYCNLLEPLGCGDDGEGLELAAHPDSVAAVRARLGEHRPVVGFAPGAAFGPSKRWPLERFAKVADTLTQQCGAQCVLIAGPGEEDTRQAMRRLCQCDLMECDEGRPTIDTLKATVSALDLLVCNDSGPRHVAVAFKIPTVCVMGSTKPVYSAGPYERGEVIRINVDCGPCQKPFCKTDFRCMTGIPPERVVQSALEMLGG